jgi:hypothetical protein
MWCPNHGLLHPEPSASISLPFAQPKISGTGEGKSEFTEGAIVSCGELKQCLHSCVQIIVNNQAINYCKEQQVNN